MGVEVSGKDSCERWREGEEEEGGEMTTMVLDVVVKVK